MLYGKHHGSLDPRTEIQNLTGIGHKLAKRIIEDLGDGEAFVALSTITRNPYHLTDVDGIAFKKADTVAQRDFGLHADDLRRHEAGNRWILEQKGVLAGRDFLAERSRLSLLDPDGLTAGAEIENGLYWLPEELEAEKQLERWMRGLDLVPGELPELTPVQAGICQRMNLDEVQTEAVRMALHTRVLCLTGGAGTGKTHVVAALAQCLIVTSRSVRGMAFAGKAADRMREAFDSYQVQAEASTIHKALGFQKRGFTVDMLAEDLVVIDESSMLNGWLLWQVVKRLRENAILVLVGDENQLPPIGHGTPFVDLLKHGCPRAHLSRNYRQADQQGILHMAEGILDRNRPMPAECVEMHLGVDPAGLEPLFDELITTHGSQQFEDWQVITYQNENAERYNLRAQAIINPHGPPLFEYPLWKLGVTDKGRPAHFAEIRTGDKVIVVKNSGLLSIFNGQTGRVIGLVNKPKLSNRRNPVTGFWEEVQGETMSHLRVEITGRMVDIPDDEVEKYLQLGYVITVHKAQGSDWPRVIVMQPGKVRDDTARKFFYTACTRAKNHLVVVSTLRVVAWWTNAASDAPDVPSSLAGRLARPAPCIWCEYEGCAVCDPAIRAALPAEPDWDALAEQRHEEAEAVAQPLNRLEIAVQAAEANTVTHWRTLRHATPDQAEEIVVPDHVPADLHNMFRSLVRANRE
jgi:exodeoxyribonuclease V alpha subunit